jgi:hypothetical protein
VTSLTTGAVAAGRIGRFDAQTEDRDYTSLITPGGLDGPPGDDGRYPTWALGQNDIGEVGAYSWIELPVSISVTDAQVLAISAWVYKAPLPSNWPYSSSSGMLFGLFNADCGPPLP